MIEVENEIVIELLNQGMIIDVSPGGIIFGNRHHEGGIKMLQLIENTVYLVGEMEGGEFLVNCLAREKYLARLKEIISYKGTEEGISCEEVTHVRHYIVPSGHYVYVGCYSGAIISRAGTRKFLDELIEINESTADIFVP